MLRFFKLNVEGTVSKCVNLFKPTLQQWFADELNAKVDIQNEDKFVAFWENKLRSYQNGHLYALYQQLNDEEKMVIRKEIADSMSTPYLINIACGNYNDKRDSTIRFDMLEMSYDFDFEQLYNHLLARFEPALDQDGSVELTTLRK